MYNSIVRIAGIKDVVTPVRINNKLELLKEINQSSYNI